MKIPAILVVLLVSQIICYAVPPRLAYEGTVLTKSGTAFSGNAQFKFALVTAGGAQTLWSNDGTSVGGSEPVSAIPAPVKGGAVGVMLGIGMNEIPPSVATQNDLKLRVWIDIGQGFELFSPDQEQGSVFWAFRAQQADSVPDGSITSAKFSPEVFTAIQNHKLSYLSTEAGYLTINGGLRLSGSSRLHAIELGDSATPGINSAFVDFHGGFGRPDEDFNVRLKNDTDRMLTIQGGGLIIEESFPIYARGSIELGNSSNPGINGSYIDFHGGFGRPDEDFNVRLKNDTDRMLTVHGGGLIVEEDTQLLKNVAIGGNINLLHGNGIVFGPGMLGSGRSADGSNEGSFLELRGRGYGQFVDFSNDPETDFDARIILSNDDLLSVIGATLEVPALKIVGGADIAERFSAIKESPEIKPGMVVRYAADGSQQIELCESAMDRAVAGVISDAGGIKSGLVLEQVGTAASGDHKVAMMGRVQVWADASYGSIRVGDPLISSETPGHAMRAANPSEATGAIIGKATSNLETGRDLIWMHVSLK